MPFAAYSQNSPNKISIKKNAMSSRLRHDGLYSTYDSSMMPCGERVKKHYAIFSPLKIINEKKIIYSYGGGNLNFEPLKITYYNNDFLISSVGSYYINNDTLFGFVPIELYFNGMRVKYRQAHFKGIIKSTDTIADWHMVQPYPNAPKKFNEGFRNLIKPQLLYFIQSEELLGLDSLYQVKLREKVNKR